MNIQRLEDVGHAPDATIFGRAVLPYIMGEVCTLAMAALFLGLYVREGDVVLAIAVGAIALFGTCMLPITVRACTAANWVVAIDDRGVSLKFTPLSKKSVLREEPQIAFIPYSEIAHVAAPSYARTEFAAKKRDRGTSIRADLKLVLVPSARGALAELRETIKRLRKVARTPMSGSWLVDVGDETVLVRWKARDSYLTPSLAKAVEALAPHVEVRDAE